DTLGHAIGDELIRQVADRLRSVVREDDFVARLGGDEFVVVEGRLPQARHAAIFADRVVDALSEQFEIGGHRVLVGAGVGIAVAPLDGDDEETLLKRADLALYRAKESGRGTYHFYETGLDAALLERRTIETDLRLALAGEEFRLVF